MASSETVRLLSRPRFARYFATVAGVRATGTMFTVAGVLLILERTHDLALAGLVVAAATLPAAVTGPVLGAWLDVTASRRRLIVLDRTLTALALAAFLLLAGHAPNWLLVVVAVLYGAAGPLSSGAFAAVLPEIAGPELLGIANAFEGASINAAFIVGPALAGLIAATSGAASALEVQLVVGIVLAVLIATDDTFELRPAHDAPRPQRVRQAVAEGLAAIWRIEALRWTMAIDFFYVLAWGTLNIGLPAFAVALGAGAHAAGYMWASVAAGSMLGGFLLRQRPAGLSPRAIIGGYLLAMALSAATWPIAGSLAAALALIFLTGVLDGPGLIALITLRQRLVPPRLRAQIFTTAGSIDEAVFAAGAAGAGLLHRALGTDGILLAFASLVGVAGAIAIISRLDGRAGVTAGPELEAAPM